MRESIYIVNITHTHVAVVPIITSPLKIIIIIRGVLSFHHKGDLATGEVGGERPEPLVERFLFTISLSNNFAPETLKRLPEDTGIQNLKSRRLSTTLCQAYIKTKYDNYTRIAKQGKYKKG